MRRVLKGAKCTIHNNKNVQLTSKSRSGRKHNNNSKIVYIV